jgi:YgiT-type zinc finger domain-containing protein
MFECHVCGGHVAKDESVNEVFTVGGRRVLVENIPAQVCTRCGEATFARATTESIRNLVHGTGHPTRTVPLEVFSMA